MAQATEAVVGTLNAYGISADQAASVTDRLLRTTQISNFQARDFEAVLAALAAGSDKEQKGRLLAGASARYLLGIAQRIQAQTELEAMANDLWRRRVEAQDAIARALDRERSDLHGLPAERLHAALEHSNRRDSHLGRTAWAETVGELTQQAEPSSRQALQNTAITTIAAAHTLPKHVRAAPIRAVVESAVPLAA